MQVMKAQPCTKNIRGCRYSLRKSATLLLAPAMLFAGVHSACAQSAGENSPSHSDDNKAYQTFYLVNSQNNEANDIQTDLRNMLPKSAIYYVPSQGALTIRGTAEDIATAKKILSEIDRVKKVSRLTYTLAEMDGDKIIRTQKFVLSVTSGKRTSLKEGNRIPLVSGKSDNSHGGSDLQVQYIDVGTNIEATLDGSKLQTKVEQSSLADEKNPAPRPIDDPVIRQSTLEATVSLAESKPTLIGILELPESRHSLHVTVLEEPEKLN